MRKNQNSKKGSPRVRTWTLSLLGFSLALGSAEKKMEELLVEELTEKQDYLSGDVQELIEVQTQEGVIQKLEEVETTMVEATLKLLDGETGGDTLAIQTEIIEKAYEAAQEKQKSQSSQSETDKALMDMLEKMMGEGQGEGKGEPKVGEKDGKEGDKPGDQAGKGQTGDGDPEANNAKSNDGGATGSARSVPSATNTPGEFLPQEFQEMLDDYNRAR